MTNLVQALAMLALGCTGLAEPMDDDGDGRANVNCGPDIKPAGEDDEVVGIVVSMISQ